MSCSQTTSGYKLQRSQAVSSSSPPPPPPPPSSSSSSSVPLCHSSPSLTSHMLAQTINSTIYSPDKRDRSSNITNETHAHCILLTIEKIMKIIKHNKCHHIQP